MRQKLQFTNGYDDSRVNSLAKDVQRGFDAIIDITTHKATVVWAPPMNLLVPLLGGDPRLKSPEIVRCDRARNLTDPTILVTPGSCSFEWVGNGQVRIDAAAGLTVGDKYELTFSAVG